MDEVEDQRHFSCQMNKVVRNPPKSFYNLLFLWKVEHFLPINALLRAGLPQKKKKENLKVCDKIWKSFEHMTTLASHSIDPYGVLFSSAVLALGVEIDTNKH